MKIIAIGDIHGKGYWKKIVAENDFDKLLFIGDYFDTHESITPIEQLKNFDQICDYKRKSPKDVILLIGNHDHHYFRAVGDTGTSGYQARAAKNIEFALEDNKDILQMAYSFENIIFSHAGIGETWLQNQGYAVSEKFEPSAIADFVNEQWKYKPLSFTFSGMYDFSGDDIGQTPIWIRPRALMADTKNIRDSGIIQVVGHTQVTKLDLEGSKNNADGKLIMIDCLGTSGEYLCIKDGNFSAATF